jgi:hypothetical protein
MSNLSNIAALVEDMVYVPTPTQRQVKAAYWAVWGDNPTTDSNSITLAAVMQITNDGRVSKWWSQPGFREWFTNRDEFRQRTEYLAHIALDTLEQLLVDPDANASARVNAAKLLLEATDKMPRKYAKEKLLDERINRMGPHELQQWLDRQGVTINTGNQNQRQLADGDNTDGDGEGNKG